MDSKIPKDQLRYLVDKFHVGQPDDYVRAQVRQRTTGRPGWTQARIRQAEEYALKIHHANQDMYAYVMGGMHKRKRRALNSHRRRRNPFHSPATSAISAYISMGDRVTYVDRFGKQHTGKAVMRGPAGWVLNMGGRYGTPQVVDDDMIVKVAKKRG